MTALGYRAFHYASLANFTTFHAPGERRHLLSPAYYGSSQSQLITERLIGQRPYRYSA